MSVKVKVCGLTTVENALACAEAGADWIGLNFHPASPRSISVERAAEIVRALAIKNQSTPIGLFVDQTYRELSEVAADAGLLDVQLHGDEPPEILLECRRFKPPLSVVKAFRLADRASVERMKNFLDRAEALGRPPYAILVDAHVPGQPGGTGQLIAMELLEQIPPHPRLILAGGLTPENVGEYVARVRPWMVDVASGVESSPGVKDIARVRAFVRAAKEIPVDTP
jgi:phosphoribosylanthranilate isomerase